MAATLDFEQAVDALRQRLSAANVAHSLGVADTAASIAAAYGVDADAARMAGLLHDWDRELSDDALVRAARDEGIAVTEADEVVPRLLHARTGAAALRATFDGLDEAVARAVELHTVGAVDMSELDMVVYLADMLEPERDYPGVDALRAQVGRVGLTELFALGYQRSVQHLADARRPIHPDTVAVWNRHVARERR